MSGSLGSCPHPFTCPPPLEFDALRGLPLQEDSRVADPTPGTLPLRVVPTRAPSGASAGPRRGVAPCSPSALCRALHGGRGAASPPGWGLPHLDAPSRCPRAGSGSRAGPRTPCKLGLAVVSLPGSHPAHLSSGGGGACGRSEAPPPAPRAPGTRRGWWRLGGPGRRGCGSGQQQGPGSGTASASQQLVCTRGVGPWRRRGAGLTVSLTQMGTLPQAHQPPFISSSSWSSSPWAPHTATRVLLRPV